MQTGCDGYNTIMQFWILPSGNWTVCYWTWPCLVDLPTKNADFFNSYVALPEGIHKQSYFFCGPFTARGELHMRNIWGVPKMRAPQIIQKSTILVLKPWFWGPLGNLHMAIYTWQQPYTIFYSSFKWEIPSHVWIMKHTSSTSQGGGGSFRIGNL